MRLYCLLASLFVLVPGMTSELLPTLLKGDAVVDENGPITSTQDFVLDTPFDFGGGAAMTYVGISLNGFIHLGEVNPTTFPSIADPSGRAATDILIAPLMVASSSLTDPRATYRQRDCFANQADHYWTHIDCDFVNKRLAAAVEADPYDLTAYAYASKVVVISWKMSEVDGVAQVVQSALVTLSDGNTMVIFLYDAGVTITGTSFVGFKKLTVEVTPCVSGAPVTTAALFDTFKAGTSQMCLKAGQILLDASVLIAGCQDVEEPRDSCEVSVFCQKNSDTEYQVNVQEKYTSAVFFTTVDPSTEEQNAVASCGGAVGAVITNTAVLTFNPTVAADLTLCDIVLTGTQVSVTVRLLKLEGRRQVRDRDVAVTCDVNDIPPTAIADVNVNDVGMKEELARDREVKMAVLTSSLGAPLTEPCEIGAPLVLQISYKRNAVDDVNFDPFGSYATECTLYNYDPTVTFTGRGVTVTGSDNGLPIAQVGETTLAGGCPVTGANPPPLFVLTAFTHIGTTGQGATDYEWIMETAPFDCAGYKHTDKVWIQCETVICAVPWENHALCDNTCPAVRRRRRSASKGEVEVVTTSFSVNRHGKDAEDAPTCMDSTAALATIGGLILGLLLASGLTVGGFVRLFTRSNRSKSYAN